MDFLSNNNNKTLANNNTKLLHWPIFLNVHYSLCVWYWRKEEIRSLQVCLRRRVSIVPMLCSYFCLFSFPAML